MNHKYKLNDYNFNFFQIMVSYFIFANKIYKNIQTYTIKTNVMIKKHYAYVLCD